MNLIWTQEMEVATKYQSHLPSLLACVLNSSGPIVELGVGHFSTPVLHAVCAVTNRELFSVEKDVEWLEYFRKTYESMTHHFSKDFDQHQKGIGVAFIDDSPGGTNRANNFSAFIDRAEFVVVHDYHGENEDAIGPLLNVGCHAVARQYFPPTLIATKFRANIPA